MAYESSTISSCEALNGGGMYINDPAIGTLVVTDVDIVSCSANGTLGGGGISVANGGHVELASVWFSLCWAASGVGHDVYVEDVLSGATCTAACPPGSEANTDSWACSEPYDAKVFGPSGFTCEPYCLSAATDCQVCGGNAYLSASEITANGDSAQCGE